MNGPHAIYYYLSFISIRSDDYHHVWIDRNSGGERKKERKKERRKEKLCNAFHA
jgi:hypothetical protein